MAATRLSRGSLENLESALEQRNFSLILTELQNVRPENLTNLEKERLQELVREIKQLAEQENLPEDLRRKIKRQCNRLLFSPQAIPSIMLASRSQEQRERFRQRRGQRVASESEHVETEELLTPGMENIQFLGRVDDNFVYVEGETPVEFNATYRLQGDGESNQFLATVFSHWQKAKEYEALGKESDALREYQKAARLMRERLENVYGSNVPNTVRQQMDRLRELESASSLEEARRISEGLYLPISAETQQITIIDMNSRMFVTFRGGAIVRIPITGRPSRGQLQALVGLSAKLVEATYRVRTTGISGTRERQGVLSGTVLEAPLALQYQIGRSRPLLLTLSSAVGRLWLDLPEEVRSRRGNDRLEKWLLPLDGQPIQFQLEYHPEQGVGGRAGVAVHSMQGEFTVFTEGGGTVNLGKSRLRVTLPAAVHRLLDGWYTSLGLHAELQGRSWSVGAFGTGMFESILPLTGTTVSVEAGVEGSVRFGPATLRGRVGYRRGTPRGLFGSVNVEFDF